MTRPGGPGGGGLAGTPGGTPGRRGFVPGNRVILEPGHGAGTVAAKPAGYAVDESTVWVNWDTPWGSHQNPSPEAARLLLSTTL